ncbi:hypothetical protein F4604DRAFT_1920260 [Suillus subluteus]|nr:hypothetical protein F4604DRAFT_1920260 [Suillus subluteus]
MHNGHPLSGLAITVVPEVQDAQADLDAADSFQDTSQTPQEIRRCYWEDHGCMDPALDQNRTNLVPQVHLYAKMALGVLSCAAKIILTQVDRDAVVLKLLMSSAFTRQPGVPCLRYFSLTVSAIENSASMGSSSTCDYLDVGAMVEE